MAEKSQLRGVTRSIRIVTWLLLATALAPGQRSENPYRAYLWIDSSFPIASLTAELRATLGLGGVSHEAEDPTDALFVSGIPYYLDQLVADGILHVKEPAFAEVLRAPAGDPAWERRPRCLRDPAVREDAERQIATKLARYREHPPDFVSLRDEPSYTRLLNPADWCRDDACAQAFADFAVSHWGGLDRLRAGWGLAEGDPLPDFGAPSAERPALLRPPLTDVARRAFFQTRRRPEALVGWNDAREFADLGFAQAMGRFADAARERLPGVRAGFLGGQMPSAFGGFDWERLCAVSEVLEPYDYGAAREIVRSFARPDAVVLHTCFAPEREPLASVHELWHYALHGDSGAVLFAADGIFEGADPARPSAWARALAPHLRLLTSDALAGFRRAREAPAQVAVLLSMPSVRAHWMADSASDGATWRRRLTSHEVEDSSDARNRVSWCAVLEDLGLRYEFVTPKQLRDGILASRGYEALVLPRVLALAKDEAAAISAFSRRGRFVAADGELGAFNAKLREHAAPVLDELFGLERATPEAWMKRRAAGSGAAGVPYPVDDGALAVAAGARALRRASEVPILVSANDARLAGAGRRLYLNLRIDGYARDRIADPAKASWLLDQLRPHFLHSGVVPEVGIDRLPGSASWPVEVFQRSAGATLYLGFHLNLRPSLAAVSWPAVAEAGAVRLRVTLRRTLHGRELLSGRAVEAGNVIEVELAADRPAVFELER